MKTAIAFVSGALLLATTSSSSALTQTQVDNAMQALAGTLDAYSQPSMSQGTLMGCQLIFDAIIQDYAYHQGGFLKVSGSTALMIARDPNGESQPTLGAIVKIVVNSLENGNLVPSPPTRGYLIGPSFQTDVSSLVNASPSDIPGGLYSIYQISPTLQIITDGLKRKVLTFAFNQKGGNSDIQIPIDLTVSSTDANGRRVHDDSAVQGFAQCSSALIQQFRQ